MKRLYRTKPVIACFSAWLCAAAVVAESPYDGHWQGSIELPTGSLEFDVDFISDSNGEVDGDISIPVQNLKDLDLEVLEQRHDGLRFQIPGIPGDPRFDGTLSADGNSLAGAFNQGPAALTFSLRRALDPGVEVARALTGFDELVERALTDFKVPGLGLAIVRGDQVVYAEGFGHRDLERRLAMTADTLFAIGSTTKAMTSTVLAMQAEQGLVDWEEPLVRYLPSFRLADPMITARLTPRDLVTHRSGMSRHDLLWYGNDQLSRREVIERFPHLELTADLRQRFQYNNLMYMTAGYLAGQLDGGTWEESMRRRLFEPLAMRRSNFSVVESQKDPNHALPYRENDDEALVRLPFRNIDLIGPAGSVNSSVREMAQWLRFNLAGGSIDGTPLLDPATLRDVHSPHMTIETPPFDETQISQIAYGLGWNVETYRGLRRLRHNGGIDGFITTVMLFPDHDLGLVAFNNRGSGLPMLIAQLAADRILGLEPIDWTGKALAERQQQEAAGEAAEADAETARITDTKPSHALADYAGFYRHPGYGDLRVELAADTLSWTYNGIVTPLEHWHYDVWNGSEEAVDPTMEGTKVQFRADLDGFIAEAVVIMDPGASPVVFSKQPNPLLSDAAHLQRFSGKYQGPTGQVAKVEVQGSKLTVELPGQPLYTLTPQVSGRFAIEGLSGFSLAFEDDAEGKVQGVAFHQPDGVFRFLRLED